MDYQLDTYDQYIFDEKGNQITVLREESWNGRPAKLTLRKCIIDKDGNEKPHKGFAFLTEEGPHRLAEELVRRGYGVTSVLLESIKEREDVEGEDIKDIKVDEEEYFDPKEIFAKEV